MSSENVQVQAISRKPLSDVQIGGSSETIRRISQIDETLASLVAILFTDGCVSRKGVNSWRIYFSNKSKVLIKLFKDSIIAVFGLDASRVRIGRTRDGLLKAVVDSAKIGHYLFEKFGTFRTLSMQDGTPTKAKLPVVELLESGKVKTFLRVAFSCDGGVSCYPAYRSGKKGGTRWLIRTVFLSCAHERLRKEYQFLLKILGIYGKDVPKDGKIKIETEKGIRKFYQEVGFVPGVQVTDHSKFWRGYEKQYVLGQIIDSYGKPAEIYNLPRFHLR